MRTQKVKSFNNAMPRGIKEENDIDGFLGNSDGLARFEVALFMLTFGGGRAESLSVCLFLKQ